MINFKTDLYSHQKRAADKLSKVKVGALYMEQGTGKTRAILELIKIRLEKEKINKVLWLCPCSVKKNLLKDIVFHCGDELKDLVLICGIETLSSSIDTNSKLLEYVKSNNVYLIVDESNLVKNWKAYRTERIIMLSSLCKYKAILNGTPISKNEADLFAQWYILDWRILGYRSFGSFAANHVEYDDRYPDRIRNCLNVDYLSEKIAPYTYQVTKEECLELPNKKYHYESFRLTNEQDTHYENMANELLFSVNELESYTIYRLFAALQNILSGYRVKLARRPERDKKNYGDNKILVKDKMFIDPIENPRIQALLDSIEKYIGPEKCIIFSKYTDEIDDIIHILNKKYGSSAAVGFYGKIKQNNRQNNLELFRESTQFLVANKACGAYGLNLQFCRNIIYYSNDWDYATRIQSEDRIHRIGQENDVNIIDIYAEHTLDDRIINCLQKKGNLLECFKKEVANVKDKDMLYYWIQRKDHFGKRYKKSMKALTTEDLKEDIGMLVFKNNRKKEFYSLIGEFFADKKYKKVLPYLSNDEETTWYVKTKGDEVLGFLSFKIFKDKVHIGYCYVIEDSDLEKELLSMLVKENKDKEILIELEKSFATKNYKILNFKVYKESKNYYYLKRERAGGKK